MLKHVILLCLFATDLHLARATEDITVITSILNPGTPSAAEGYNFQNTQEPVTGLTTATNSYAVLGVADHVFVRRNAVSLDQSSVWYASSGVSTDLSGVHQNDYGTLLLSNNLNAGSDNTFANSGTGSQVGNIERLDFTWNSPITVTNSFALAVFDRGAVGLHDSFAIAAILSVDAAGNPTSFGTSLHVSAGWGGTANPVSDFSYRLFRYNTGDVMNNSTANSETNTQGIGGVVIRNTDLSITSGTQIYGYSLMANDVTATNSTQLLDWTNSTYYPTNTDGNTGGGGIDLAAVNGIVFIAVPEPATSALALLALSAVGGSALLRRQRAKI
ncbi:MAG: PEP-CTERM sorting domain-containing protein [Chthoniobacterales bacterium]